jgi:imidazolonepropionase-like amidohydrolase
MHGGCKVKITNLLFKRLMSSYRHSRAGGNPILLVLSNPIHTWIPACAGMTALILRYSLLGIAVLASEIAHAVPNIPPPPQSQPIMITGATLHTVSGASIPNGRMLLDKGRIVAIGAANDVADVPNAKVINLAGKHVYPGFISAHSALGLVEVQAVRATVDTAEAGAINPNSRAVVAVNADSELIPVTRANGVLAAHSVPQAGATGLIAGTSALIQLDGWNWEDMGIQREVGLFVALPSMRGNAALASLAANLTPQQMEEMQRLSTRRLRALEEAFESAAAYAKAKSSGEAIATDTRWEAMLPVINGKRTVFFTADELPQMRYALAFAERFNLKIAIVGGQDAWRIAALLKERNVPVIIGGTHRLPIRRGEDVDAPFKLAAQLHEAGVRFAIARGGSSFDAAMDRSLPFEAGTAVAHGLPRTEAIKAISLYPAQILGVEDKLGSLERGKHATFFVSDGDPLDIRSNVEKIFVQGRELALEDKQTRLQKKYEEKYKQLGATRGAGAAAK